MQKTGLLRHVDNLLNNSSIFTGNVKPRYGGGARAWASKGQSNGSVDQVLTAMETLDRLEKALEPG